MLLPACPHPCRDTAAKEVDHEEDAYGECYPMQAAFAGQMVDSDEEDFSAMDQKGGKGMGVGWLHWPFWYGWCGPVPRGMGLGATGDG